MTSLPDFSLKAMIAPGIRLLLQEQYGLSPEGARKLYDRLESDPELAVRMFPPAEEDVP